MVLGCRDDVGIAVDRAPAGGEDDAARPRIHRRAQDVHRAHHVDVGVVQRVAHRLADIDLCGRVEDHFGTRIGNRSTQFRRGDVQLHKGRACIDLLAPAAGQIVDHGHAVTGIDERIGDVRADEPGAAGDERSHPWVATRCALGACTWVTTKMTKPITTRLP